MLNIAVITLKGIFRDRVFHGICVVAILFLFLPLVSSLSMRQVEQLSVSLSLSLISFILLLLALFLGGAALWKDIDRRHTYTILGLPVTRQSYFLGKYFGVTLFMSLVVISLSVLASGAIFFSAGKVPPTQPLNATYIAIAILFDFFKYSLVVAFAFLFSTVSTSFFLPLFGTIAIFLVGNASQEVFDFVQADGGEKLPYLVKIAATGLYYILPNFAAFDLKLNAIYSLTVDMYGLAMTFVYYVLYLSLVLSVAVYIFNRRELK